MFYFLKDFFEDLIVIAKNVLDNVKTYYKSTSLRFLVIPRQPQKLVQSLKL